MKRNDWLVLVVCAALASIVTFAIWFWFVRPMHESAAAQAAASAPRHADSNDKSPI